MPAALAPSPTITPTPAPQPPEPAPSTAPPIHVVPGSTEPVAAPPKPGSARERMFKELRKKVGAEPEEPSAPPTPPAKAEAADEPPAETPAPPAAEKKKVNPWKLLDEYKAARKKAEEEVAELRKLVPNEKARRDEMEKLQRFEARAKELEEEMRYVNYTKTEEFQTRYQQPYEKKWKDAMADLKELQITDAEGNTRPMQPQDMLELVNMPLGKARELAKTMFGDFADDVMAHRKEIRQLADRQAEALAEAKKTGDIRERERRELFERQSAEFKKFIGETWEAANKEAMEHEQFGKLFQPIEGDDEGNERLKKRLRVGGQGICGKSGRPESYHGTANRSYPPPCGNPKPCCGFWPT